jgi:hypothetical protein
LIRLNPTDDNMEKQSDFASQYYAILIIVLDVLIQEWILKIQHIKKKNTILITQTVYHVI